MDQLLHSYLLNSHVSVSVSKTEAGRLRYKLSEPDISPEKQILFQKILSLLEDSFNPDLFEKEADDDETVLQKAVSDLLKTYSIHLFEDDLSVLNYYLHRNF